MSSSTEARKTVQTYEAVLRDCEYPDERAQTHAFFSLKVRAHCLALADENDVLRAEVSRLQREWDDSFEAHEKAMALTSALTGDINDLEAERDARPAITPEAAHAWVYIEGAQASRDAVWMALRAHAAKSATASDDGLMHDRVHTDPGPVRAGRSARSAARSTPVSDGGEVCAKCGGTGNTEHPHDPRVSYPRECAGCCGACNGTGRAKGGS